MTQINYQNLINDEKNNKLAEYKTILDQSKGQIIFYGPPGTGKTYIAKQLANLITNGSLDGWSSSSHRKIVQFHPSYSYEDFVQGIKPVKIGPELDYQIRPGIFQKLCQPLTKLSTMTWRDAAIYVLYHEQEYGEGPLHYKVITKRCNDLGIKTLMVQDPKQPHLVHYKAQITEEIRTKSERSIFKQSVDGRGSPIKGTYELNKDSPDYTNIINNLPQPITDESPKVLIIDEINRGNLSKIFGELIYGLEYRNEEIDLQYKEFDEGSEYGTLTVPPKDQLMIIGTMNTADRSIVLFDAALRRRFSFIPLVPDYDLLAQSLHIDYRYNRDKFLAKLSNTTDDEKNKILSILALKKINSELASDPSIGREKQIGHTFLLELQEHPGNFEKVWKYDILPLLEEYYFEAPEKIQTMFTDAIYTINDGIKTFDANVLRFALIEYAVKSEE